MLGVVVTETLYRTHPDLSEGRLAKLRAAVVNARALAEVGRGIGLGEHIKLGRGEESTGGRDKASILSDTVEAVIGAVHLSEGGIATSSEVVHLLFDPLIEAASALGAAWTGRPRCRSSPPSTPSACRSTSSPTRAPTT